LERKIGQQALEIDILKECLQREAPDAAGIAWESAVSRRLDGLVD
jgi:hypothetical protein